MLSSDFFAAAVGIGLVVYIHVYYRKRSTLPLPPGPRRFPLIGNILQLPKECSGILWARWAQQYSTVYPAKGLWP